MSALTGGAAKELLPVGGIPLLLRVMHECAASGVREVLVVSAPGKRDLEMVALDAAGSPGMPDHVRVVVQEEPRGLADAIRMAKDFSGPDAFGVVLPDNLFVAEIPALAQVDSVRRRTGKSVVAVVEIAAADKLNYGPTAILPGRVKDGEFVIESIPDKGSRREAFDTDGRSSAFTGVGRFVFLPEVFDAIDAVDLSLRAGQELDDVPVMQLLLRRTRLTGCKMRGEFLDVGLPAGYRWADERMRLIPSGRL
jgi:UTP-glucose-1-phosphate uridylyltransferase